MKAEKRFGGAFAITMKHDRIHSPACSTDRNDSRSAARLILPLLKRTSLALVFVMNVAAAWASEVYWPGWLGPNRDGQVEYFEPPSDWPKELALDWSVEVGWGGGTPLVSEKRIYLHTREDGDEVVSCRDLNTGNRIWLQRYRVPYQISSPGERHGNGPNSNPSLADGRLFTFSITGILSAWSTDSGRLLWRRDYADHYQPPHPKWGHSTSPLIDGQRVIVHVGGEEAGRLVAFDAATGEEVWTSGSDGSCHASPIRVEIQGVRQIVEWNHEAVVGVESKTGRRLWSYELPHRGSNQNSPTPVFYQGRLLVGGENRGIRSLEPRLENGEWRVIENWHQRKVSLNMASAVMGGGSLYGKSHLSLGQFFRLDPLSGEILWLSASRKGEYASFLSIPGHIIALRNDANLEIIPSGEESYRAIATYEVAESPTWTAPVLLKDGLLIKSRTKLYKWRFPN